MKRTIGIALVGALAVFGASCGDDETNGGGGTGGGGTGGSDGGCFIEITAEEISADETWDRTDCDYILTRITYVVGAKLTIAAGVTVKGDAGSALVITSTGEIDAQGTASNPIVMTSSRAESARKTGDWGGLALLGKAILSWGGADCDGTGDCTATLEGLPSGENRAEYGGDDDTHNCGTVKYVRIEYAGNEIAPNNELNGLTLGGCGSGSTIEYVQIHRGLDDALEIFGGAVNAQYILMSGMGDDGLDWDQGYRGTVMNFIVHHFAGSSSDPRGIEADNNSENNLVTPRSQPTVMYGTLVADAGAKHDQGIVLRRGTWGDLDGMVVEGFTKAGVDIRDGSWDASDGAMMPSRSGGWPTELSVEGSCFFGNSPNYPVDSDPCTGTDTDDDCNDESELTTDSYFAENTEMADAARNNLEVDPEVGDYSSAATGGTPNYQVGNGDCMGGYATPSGEVVWTEGWTTFPL